MYFFKKFRKNENILLATKEGNQELVNKLTRVHFNNTYENIIKNINTT